MVHDGRLQSAPLPGSPPAWIDSRQASRHSYAHVSFSSLNEHSRAFSGCCLTINWYELHRADSTTAYRCEDEGVRLGVGKRERGMGKETEKDASRNHQVSGAKRSEEQAWKRGEQKSQMGSSATYHSTGIGPAITTSPIRVSESVAERHHPRTASARGISQRQTTNRRGNERERPKGPTYRSLAPSLSRRRSMN